ncbi:uncharacterized protein METZ01_LOCUS39926 [marine metagenome]|uniref:Uncharacterized protein n=1 Tax=marine metagenome TaxID=408172 RepID=A0A381R5W0_9ZZZZ
MFRSRYIQDVGYWEWVSTTSRNGLDAIIWVLCIAIVVAVVVAVL